MSTAETLVKDAQTLLDDKVMVPIILEKCAARGYTPKTDAEMQVVLGIASDIREKVASGELAPVPASALNEDGTMSKEASDKVGQDVLAYAEDLEVNLDELDPTIKEAAACVAWGTLEALATAHKGA